MGRVFDFYCSGGTSEDASPLTTLESIQINDVSTEIKPLLIELVELLLNVDTQGPNSMAVLFHPFFIRSQKKARKNLEVWLKTSYKRKQLIEQLSSNNFLLWINAKDRSQQFSQEEQDILTKILSEVIEYHFHPRDTPLLSMNFYFQKYEGLTDLVSKALRDARKLFAQFFWYSINKYDATVIHPF